MATRIFVAGTDTGIGKTVVSAHLVASLLNRGTDVLYVKPYQTGVTSYDHPDSDAHYVERFCGRDDVAMWVEHFRAPKAPYYAALDEGASIDPARVRSIIEDVAERHDVLVLEGAGGLLVPITEEYMNVDLVRDTADVVLLVARASLGTINHTLLSLEILDRHAPNTPVVVVLNDVQPSTPRDLLIQNVDAIQRFGSARNVFALPHLGAGHRWEPDMIAPIAETLLA